MADLIFLQKFRFRINIQRSCISIHNSHVTVPFFLYFHFHQCGNCHGFRHDRYVGNDRSLMHDYRQKAGFVHLQEFIWGKLLCRKDHRLISQVDPRMGTTHGADQKLRNLPDIFDLLFDSLILQLAKYISQLVSRCLHCIGRTDLFCCDHAFHCPLETAST